MERRRKEVRVNFLFRRSGKPLGKVIYGFLSSAAFFVDEQEARYDQDKGNRVMPGKSLKAHCNGDDGAGDGKYIPVSAFDKGGDVMQGFDGEEIGYHCGKYQDETQFQPDM